MQDGIELCLAVVRFPGRFPGRSVRRSRSRGGSTRRAWSWGASCKRDENVKRKFPGASAVTLFRTSSDSASRAVLLAELSASNFRIFARNNGQKSHME